MAKGKQKFYVVWYGHEPGVYTEWSECQKQIMGFKGAKHKSYPTRVQADEAFMLGPEDERTDGIRALAQTPAQAADGGAKPGRTAAGKAVAAADSAAGGKSSAGGSALTASGTSSATNGKSSAAGGKKLSAKTSAAQTSAAGNAAASEKSAAGGKKNSAKTSAAQASAPCVPPALPAGVLRDAVAVDAACSGNPGKMEYRGIYLKTGQLLFHFGPCFGTNNIGEFLAIVHALALIKQRGAGVAIYSDSRNAMLWVKGKKCKTTLVRNAKTAELYNVIARAEKWLRENKYDTPVLKWDTAHWGEIPADFGRKH